MVCPVVFQNHSPPGFSNAVQPRSSTVPHGVVVGRPAGRLAQCSHVAAVADVSHVAVAAVGGCRPKDNSQQPPIAMGPSDRPCGRWQWLLVVDTSAIRPLWPLVAVAQQPPTATKPWLLSVAVAQQPRGHCDSHISHVAVVALGRRTPTATWPLLRDRWWLLPTATNSHVAVEAVDPLLFVAVRGCRAWLSVAVDA